MPSGVQTEVKTYQMFINGEWVGSNPRRLFPFTIPRRKK
jgi:type 1 glutamine amidotransferase